MVVIVTTSEEWRQPRSQGKALETREEWREKFHIDDVTGVTQNGQWLRLVLLTMLKCNGIELSSNLSKPEKIVVPFNAGFYGNDDGGGGANGGRGVGGGGGGGGDDDDDDIK